MVDAVVAPDKNLYSRLIFNVYWMDASPSSEIFYTPFTEVLHTPAEIAALEQEVVTLLQTQNATTRTISATYVGVDRVVMTAADITAAGWRVQAWK